MGYVYMKPFDYYDSPGGASCVGYVDPEGYIYKKPFSTYFSPGSSSCIGRITPDGYVFNDPHSYFSPGSPDCVGKVSDSGYVFSDPRSYDSAGSSDCVGFIEDGFIYNDPLPGPHSAGSACCIGKTDGYGIEAKGAAAMLLLLRNSFIYVGDANAFNTPAEDSYAGGSYGGGGGLDFSDFGGCLMSIIGVPACFAFFGWLIYLLFKSWGVFG